MFKKVIAMVVLIVALLFILGSSTHASVDGSGAGPSGTVENTPTCPPMQFWQGGIGCLPISDDAYANVDLITTDSECTMDDDWRDNVSSSRDVAPTLPCIYATLAVWAHDSGLSLPNQVVFIDVDVDATGTPCPADDNSGHYCGIDSSIYIGANMLWGYLYNNDALGYYLLAHEYGHYLQQVAMMPGSETPNGMIPAELQADCVAGVFMAWMFDHELMNDSTDMAAVNAMFSAPGEPEDERMIHGTNGQRSMAWYSGFLGTGLESCNYLVTNVQLFSN